MVTNRRYLPEELKLRGYRLAIIGVRDRAARRVLDDRRRSTSSGTCSEVRRSIATVCLSGTLEDKLAAAAAAGFDEVELFEPDLIASPLTPARGAAARRGARASRSALYQPFRDFEAVPRGALRRRTCGARSASSR